MLAYSMNIEECMNVKFEIDRKPWYHDIKAYIKDGDYLLGATNSERRFIKCMACQVFLKPSQNFALMYRCPRG